MIATYHNHSKWSDGQSTFGDMYSYAAKNGVDILGLSDHFCIYPDGTSADWSLDPGKLDDYLADVTAFRDAGGMDIRVGLEFDWFENHYSVIAPYVEKIPLDYRIGAVHHVELQQFDMDMAYWTSKSVELRASKGTLTSARFDAIAKEQGARPLTGVERRQFRRLAKDPYP